MQSTETFRWLATAWGLLLFVGFGYYIWRSWRRRTVTLVGRSGTLTFSRDTEPLFYWGILLFYMVIAAGLLFLLSLRAYYVTRQIAPK